MLLIIDGHKTRLNLTASLIFWLSGIDVLVHPAHSTQLLQMFDAVIAEPLKIVFKHEFNQQISQFVKKSMIMEIRHSVCDEFSLKGFEMESIGVQHRRTLFQDSVLLEFGHSIQ
jgi:hypothetical protein